MFFFINNKDLYKRIVKLFSLYRQDILGASSLNITFILMHLADDFSQCYTKTNTELLMISNVLDQVYFL